MENCLKQNILKIKYKQKALLTKKWNQVNKLVKIIIRINPNDKKIKNENKMILTFYKIDRLRSLRARPRFRLVSSAAQIDNFK